MYSFKHALTQDVVYCGPARAASAALPRRGRRAGSRSSTPGGLDEVVGAPRLSLRRAAPTTRRRSTTRSSPAEKAQRRWANAEALAPLRRGAASASTSMPDTDAQPAAPDRRGRQAGRGEVRARPARRARRGAGAITRPGRRSRRSAAAGDVVLLDRLPAEPRRARARASRSRYCREALAIADASGLRRHPGRSRSAASRHVSAWRPAICAARCEAGERALGGVRGARQRLVGVPHAVGAQPGGELPRRLGAQPRRTAVRRSSTGSAVNDLRLKVVGWWRTGSTHVQRGDPETGPRAAARRRSPLSPIPFDAAMIAGGARATGSSRPATSRRHRGARGGGGMVRALAAAITRARSCALWLAEGHLALGRRAQARAVARHRAAASAREQRLPAPRGDGRAPARANRLVRTTPSRRASTWRRGGRILDEVGCAQRAREGRSVAQADLPSRGGRRRRRARDALERRARSSRRSARSTARARRVRAGVAPRRIARMQFVLDDRARRPDRGDGPAARGSEPGRDMPGGPDREGHDASSVGGDALAVTKQPLPTR